MAKKIIKHLLYTYFDEVPNQAVPGAIALQEQLGRLGEERDITRDVDLQRGEELGAFYTDEEAKAIEDGTYDGPDAEALSMARSGTVPTPTIQPADGEHGDIASMDTEALAALIAPSEFGEEGKDLTVDETVALAGDGSDPDLINKVLDAENMATNNEPRKGVQDRLEAKLAAASG